MNKVIRTSTIPVSLDILLKGQLEFLNQQYDIIAISGDGDNLKNLQIREKVRVVPIEMQRRISPLRDLVSLWKLYRVFKLERPLIVHSITPKAGLLSMIAAYLARVPIRIHTFTGLVFPSKVGVFQKTLIIMDKILSYCATNIYPEGEGVKRDLINYKITNKYLTVIANGNVNGIDVNYFNPNLFSVIQNQIARNKLDIDAEDFVFIFVGRLVRDKGINEMINVFEKISTDFPNVKLILVGPYELDLDPLESNTMQVIHENKKIISVGFQDDIRPYLAMSNCFVFPSYREGFPNVVMQAGAMGLPCIVTDINGSNEIIIEGENGTIIPAKEELAIYDAMKKMIEDSDYRIRLQNTARHLIVSRYEQELVWNATLAEYKRLENNV